MRIAIATDWFAPRRGGIEAQLTRLSERLGANGHHVDVLTTTPGAVSGKTYSVRPLDAFALPGLHVAVSPRLVTALRGRLRNGYDVVHAHVSVVSPVGYAAAAVARALDLPTAVTFHSVLRHKRHLLRAADAVTGLSRSAVEWSAVSDVVAAQVRDALPAADVSVLPNGIDLGFWRSTSRTSRGPSSAVTLVSATRFARKKRPLELIRAFARASASVRRPATLLLVGDGPLRSTIEREVALLGLNRGPTRVEVRDWVTAEALRALYSEADGFVLPSLRESFGISALEARTAGLPVIAMREAGSSEFLHHEVNALLCEDDHDLTAALARFIADGALRTCLAGATARADRYDWSSVIALHEAIYARAIARAAGARRAAAST
ncbi:MAG TPA: glycosyltransferase family 4 protein [Gemmatimonadaceae bacterium]|nr:glycosyltransferase family 4 protein [Gemmatimonadaceae bacterium]